MLPTKIIKVYNEGHLTTVISKTIVNGLILYETWDLTLDPARDDYERSYAFLNSMQVIYAEA
jgi:hypothetical protein